MIEHLDLSTIVPEKQWKVYDCIIRTARERDIPFALGGALAMGTYTERWRNTKDIDLYVMPKDRPRMIEVFHDWGLVDYYDTLPYDRRWIYRGSTDDCIVDAIWAMANMRAEVDETWLTRGNKIDLDGMEVAVLPPEELIWSKLYVMQRERCDWPDVLNIMYATAPTLDWHHLMNRIGDDTPLLKGVLSIFAWLCPSCADYIPDGIRMQLDIMPENPRTVTPIDSRRVELLDTRPWFGPDAQAA